MIWLFRWYEGGKLQVRTVHGTAAAQALDEGLQARNIFASLKRMKARAT